jgi:hypothetical protein
MRSATNDLFYCYSTNLFHFLKGHGQRYVVTGLHEKTMRKFWVFPKTDELKALLTKYDEVKSHG